MRIEVCDKFFVPFISTATIGKAVRDVAAKINRDYKDKKPIFISTLNGAFMFTSDLMKEIEVDSSITFIKVSSYCGDKSTGQVTHVLGLNIDIKGRDVIIIDDIVDSGVTINELYSIVSGQKPSSIAIAAFIFKPNSYKGGVKIDYIGMTMQDNNFIVGYGLDYNEKGRNFPEIYIAE